MLRVGTSTPGFFATTTLSGSGFYRFSVTGIATDTPFSLWSDNDGTLRAFSFMKASSSISNITGFDLYQNDVLMKSGGVTGTSTKASDLYGYDSSNDSDIQVTASSTLGSVVLSSGNSFFVATSSLFNLDLPLTVPGNFTVSTSSTLMASSSLTVGGDFWQNGALSAGTDWGLRNAASSNGNWYSITYGNGTFVAISHDGGGGIVMTSPDGITWAEHAAAEDNYWSSVTYGNGLFVAVAYNVNAGTHRVMTSPDGVTWTARSEAEANAWISVAYGNGVYVAIADASNSYGGPHLVMTSPDGITWTARTASDSSMWRSVIYAAGLFVAVGNVYGVGTHGVMTSPDGITWTSRDAAENNVWESVAYGNGLFVAVSSWLNSGTYGVMTSPDGITWTSRNAAESGTWTSVTYGNGEFMAIGSSIMASSDGINWASQISLTGNWWTSVAFGNGTFVSVSDCIDYSTTQCVVSSSGGGSLVTLNGTSPQILSGNLTASSSLPALQFLNSGTKTFRSDASSTALWVATSSGAVSTSHAISSSGKFINNATFVGGTLLDLGGDYVNAGTFTAPANTYLSGQSLQYASGTMTGTSAFGSLSFSGAGSKRFSFDASTSDFTVNTGSGEVVTPNFLTVSGNYTNNSSTTNTYARWNARTGAGPDYWSSVTYGNGLFVAVSSWLNSGTYGVMTSPDGITWTGRNAAENNGWNSVTYGNGLFVAVGSLDSGTHNVMTSPDGITWTSRDAAENNPWSSVTYGNGLFVAVASSLNAGTHYVMTSPDGITWTPRDAAEDSYWCSVTYGNGLFVAVAQYLNTGTHYVMTSPDGITWTNRDATADNPWIAVTYGNGLFVSVANYANPGTHGVMTSPDGITWTGRDGIENNSSWQSITYGNGLFVVVASGGVTDLVETSPDGITWTPRSAAENNYWYSVAYGNGLFVSVANYLGDGTHYVMTSGASTLFLSSTSPQTLSGTMTGSSVLGNVAFITSGTKTFSNNASTSNFTISSGSGTVTAPSLLSISGNYSNAATFDANSGTTTLNGTFAQTLSGTMTGTSAFSNLELTNSSASTTFANSASTTGLFFATTPNTQLEFAPGATSTFQNFVIAGTSGNEINLFSGTPGSKWNIHVPGVANVSYARLQDSDACSNTGGLTSVNGVDGGNNPCWNFSGASPALTLLHYRFRMDHESEVSAGYYVAEDTTLSNRIYGNDRIRLRTTIENTGAGPATDYSYRIEYASSSCTTWSSLGTTKEWFPDLTQYVGGYSSTTDAGGLSNPGGLTWQSGVFQSGSDSTGAYTLPANYFTEHEYTINSTALAKSGVTYCFRLTNAGSITNFTYAVQPQIMLRGDARPQSGGYNSEANGAGAAVPGGSLGGGGGGGGGNSE